MPTYQLDLILEEPTTFGESPLVGNEVSSLDYVPATALRGALAAALSRRLPASQRDTRLGAWFGSSFPRWTPGFPLLKKRRALCVPMPACLVCEKGEPAFQFFNSAIADVPETVGEYRRRFGHAPKGYTDDHRFAWQRVRHHWLAINTKGYPQAYLDVPKGNHLHVALHYGRQSHRDEQLFSRTGIESSTLLEGFRAFVDDPDGVIQPEEQIE